MLLTSCASTPVDGAGMHPTAGVDAERANSLFCSSSFARRKMSSITRQFSAESLSSFLDGVAVLLRDGVRRLVERPKGPFSRVSRCEDLSGLSLSSVKCKLKKIRRQCRREVNPARISSKGSRHGHTPICDMRNEREVQLTLRIHMPKVIVVHLRPSLSPSLGQHAPAYRP